MNTRKAYARAIAAFWVWLDRRGIGLDGVEPITVAAYIEGLNLEKSAPTVKQSLAAMGTPRLDGAGTGDTNEPGSIRPRP